MTKMGNPANILVVDDFDDVRESLADILEYEGYNIIQASNGLQALEVLSKNVIDLLVVDILMPDMDGIELATEVRKYYPEKEIVMISGGGRRLKKGSAYDYLSMATKLTGIENVLKKPFKPEELFELIGKLLNKKARSHMN